MLIANKTAQNKIDNWRKSHKKEFDFLMANREKCNILKNKRTYSVEEIDVALQLIPIMDTLKDIVNSTDAPIVCFPDSKPTHLEKRRLLETGKLESIAPNFAGFSEIKLKQ